MYKVEWEREVEENLCKKMEIQSDFKLNKYLQKRLRILFAQSHSRMSFVISGLLGSVYFQFFFFARFIQSTKNPNLFCPSTVRMRFAMCSTVN